MTGAAGTGSPEVGSTTLRIVFALAALSLLGAACCGDYDDWELGLVADDLEVPWIGCPCWGGPPDPECPDPSPVVIDLEVVVADAQSGDGVCGVEVEAESYYPDGLYVIETPRLSDEDGRVEFELLITEFPVDANTCLAFEVPVFLTAGDAVHAVRVVPLNRAE